MSPAEIQALKVGDTWKSIASSRSGAWVKTNVVERFTDASIWISGDRYCRKTGRKVGGGYCSGIPSPATPERIAEVRAEHEARTLRRRFRESDWNQPLETLRAVAALLEKESAP